MSMVRTILAGTVDVSVVIRIIDATDGTPETGVVFNTAGIDLQYRRELAASTAITEATLAALTTAHADGGFLHIGNGYYRLDLPDAACATGVAGVLVHGTVTGMVVIGCYIELVAYDPFTAPPDAADIANEVRTELTTELGRIDTPISNVETDTQNIQSRLPAALVGGRIDSSVGAFAAGVLVAAAIAADALAAIANKVEAEIIDETDSEKVLEAITNKIAAVNPDLSGLTLAAIAAAVRTNFAVELARIDAAISSRLASAGYTAPPTAADVAAAVQVSAAATPLPACVKKVVNTTLQGDGSLGNPWLPV